MSIAMVLSRAQFGMQALLVNVEVHLSNGLPSFSIVGLPEAAVRESKDRVRAALINSNFEFPARRIIVNLAPAELPKQGGRFDLPIALGLLVASKQIPADSLTGYEFIGELSLSGELRKSTGILPAAYACHCINSKLITSIENKDELTPLHNDSYLCASHLLEVCAHLNDIKPLQTPPAQAINNNANNETLDLSEVHGQQRAKRALCIAAAGHHHLLMVGSPGSGKTMLASRFPSLLTELNQQQMLETMSLYSIANVSEIYNLTLNRPFRAPHHTVSTVGLVGGGSTPRPGEISLAHNGVLFLDEFTEFNRQTLDALREPIETGKITISRASAQVAFPARFQLIAAMNPCPNGCDIDEFGLCLCNQQQLTRYRNKVSAPILDRIDLQISVPKLPTKDLLQNSQQQKEDWLARKQRVYSAHELQIKRQGKPNALLEGKELTEICQLSNAIENKSIQMLDQLKLSARAFHKILKMARTIADLEQTHDITQTHMSEAMSYRQFDRLQK